MRTLPGPGAVADRASLDRFGTLYRDAARRTTPRTPVPPPAFWLALRLVGVGGRRPGWPGASGGPTWRAGAASSWCVCPSPGPGGRREGRSVGGQGRGLAPAEEADGPQE